MEFKILKEKNTIENCYLTKYQKRWDGLRTIKWVQGQRVGEKKIKKKRRGHCWALINGGQVSRDSLEL